MGGIYPPPTWNKLYLSPRGIGLKKYTTHPKDKLIWDSAKVDGKKEQARVELGQAQIQLVFKLADVKIWHFDENSSF